MADSQADEVFINKPDAKESLIPYQAPAPPTNPVVRGLALYYGAAL